MLSSQQEFIMNGEAIFALSGIILALITTALAFILPGIINLSPKNRSATNAVADKIVKAAEVSTEEHRARAVELLAQKLPSTASVPEFMAALEKIASTHQNITIINNEEGASQPTTWSLVEDLVNSYHRQALDQARIQFWFSIMAAMIGFALIVVVLLTSLRNSANVNEYLLLLRAVPGITIEAIAILFLRQAAETRQRATELYDRLRTDNQRTQAVALVESIEDKTVRSVVQAQLVLHMAGLESSPFDLNSVLPKSPS